jgi:transcriptional regulator with PAS, ATPase and Fis domain
VGKEIVTRLIHYAGSGNKGPFIDVNCSAIVESLAESEFFGYSKGSFTGANCDKIGFIEAANGGTLFLDEIADTPLPIQAKFLRVLETRTMKRVGSNKTIKVNFRLISATNKNINNLVTKGLFREDLLYRINTIGIHIPPLRERKDDIAPLVDHFLKEFARRMNKPIPNYSKALEQVYNYSFPGNIRELKNIIERAMITLDGNELRLGDLGLQSISGDNEFFDVNHTTSIKQMELDMIEQALQKCGGNYTKASIMLGISYSTIRRKSRSISTKK